MRYHTMTTEQIAWFKGLRDFTDSQTSMRQDDASDLPEYMADKATAIESGLGRHAAQTIWTADQADGIHGNVFGGCAGLHGWRQKQQGQQRE